jgi:hypothetical protein
MRLTGQNAAVIVWSISIEECVTEPAGYPARHFPAASDLIRSVSKVPLTPQPGKTTSLIVHAYPLRRMVHYSQTLFIGSGLSSE